MKVKFELDVNEDFFDEISKNAYNNEFKVDLSNLFKDKKGVVLSISKEREPIYGIGLKPIGFTPYTKGEMDIQIID